MQVDLQPNTTITIAGTSKLNVLNITAWHVSMWNDFRRITLHQADKLAGCSRWQGGSWCSHYVWL